MMSIARHIDGFDIAQEVRLERRVHKGSFLLVEGDTDIKRFGCFIDESACSLVNCYGRPNAVDAIILLYDEAFPGALGVVDADFDRIAGRLIEHEGLIYSEAHDFDLDWATPSVVQRYLREVGDADKCRLHGSASEVIDKILTGLKLVSVARRLNRDQHITYKLSDIDVSECFGDFTVDLDKYVDLIFRKRIVSDRIKDNLKVQITRAASHNDDVRQLTNGHDFHCALGACLRHHLGSRRDVHTWGREVEMHLRLTFSDDDFKSSTVYLAIRKWALENPPFQVLHSRLM